MNGVRTQELQQPDLGFILWCDLPRNRPYFHIPMGDVQFVQDVADPHNQLGPILNQAVTATAGRVEDVGGNRKPLPALFSCHTRCDQRPAVFWCFGDQYTQGHATYDTVATRKIASIWGSTHMKFADERPIFDNASGQFSMFRWVDNIDPAPQNGDGASSAVKGTLMGHRIDSLGQTRYNRNPL